MEVKIDTKEKFHAITVSGPTLSASMTEELASRLLPTCKMTLKPGADPQRH